MTQYSNSSVSYSVSYRAYGVNNMAKVDNGVYDRPPTTGSLIPMTDPVPAAVQFNRFQYGPSFQLAKVAGANGVDDVPPERITDLRIASYDPSDRRAVLEWTAPKDNYGSGAISKKIPEFDHLIHPLTKQKFRLQSCRTDWKKRSATNHRPPKSIRFRMPE